MGLRNFQQEACIGDQALCFHYVLSNETATTWNAASCPGGYELASINSRHEQAIFETASFASFAGAWIGLRKATSDGAWTWDDSSAFQFMAWQSGAPSAVAPACAFLGPDRSWMDGDCGTTTRRAVCKKEIEGRGCSSQGNPMRG